MAPTAEDPRDDSELVAVVHKSHIKSGAVIEGINPGRVTLGWLRFRDNAKSWIEIDPETRKVKRPGSGSSGSIAEVLESVEKGEISAADALAAEQAKGDKARSSLVEKLTALAAAGQEG